MNTCPICNATLLPLIDKNKYTELIYYCPKINEHAYRSVGEGISHFRIYSNYRDKIYYILTMQNFLLYCYPADKLSHIYILDEARAFYDEIISDVKYIEPSP